VVHALVEAEKVPVGYCPVEFVAVGEQKPDVAHVCAFVCKQNVILTINNIFFIYFWFIG
jgi:hypothetical protein